MNIWHRSRLIKICSVWTGIALILLSPVMGMAQTELEGVVPTSEPTPTSEPAQTFGEEAMLLGETPIVYSAAKYEQKITEAPAAVTIITADQIRKYGYRSLHQVLQSVPGFFISNDRLYDYLGIRGFNRPADFNSRFLLLVDGHRLNDAMFDQAPIGTDSPIDVDLIERLEVVRGPSSSLYILRRLRRRVEFAALSKRRPWRKTSGNPGGRNCAGASDIPSKDLD
jgi:outer membrane receptor protein involved in Fe transport